ncbi:MAG TPA: hypothetical protein VF176_10695 [Solirubrobacterales bacterium]
MQRKTLTLALGLLVAGAVAGDAGAVKLRAGDLLITAHGGFTPRVLPRDHDAPITLHGGGRISTISGQLPPILETISLEYDRHGSVERRGLPVCTAGELQTTTVATARRICRGSIVGRGRGRAIVKFPGQAQFPISSPITLFNGPRKHGNDTVIAHAYTTVPVATAFVVPIEIKRIHKGVYGYRTDTRIPEIADGYGVPVAGSLKIGRKWTYRGERLSFVNARCANGRLQAQGRFEFDDGTRLVGTFLRFCGVRS